MRTAVKTIRFTHPIADLLSKEAEKRNVTVSDIVREAISDHFEHRQAEALILALEMRIAAKIDSNTQFINSGIQKILSLAQPL
jgi:hypothetical protein